MPRPGRPSPPHRGSCPTGRRARPLRGWRLPVMVPARRPMPAPARPGAMREAVVGWTWGFSSAALAELRLGPRPASELHLDDDLPLLPAAGGNEAGAIPAVNDVSA